MYERILNKFNDIILYALTIKSHFLFLSLNQFLSFSRAFSSPYTAETRTHFLLSSHYIHIVSHGCSAWSASSKITNKWLRCATVENSLFDQVWVVGVHSQPSLILKWNKHIHTQSAKQFKMITWLKICIVLKTQGSTFIVADVIRLRLHTHTHTLESSAALKAYCLLKLFMITELNHFQTLFIYFTLKSCCTWCCWFYFKVPLRGTHTQHTLTHSLLF